MAPELEIKRGAYGLGAFAVKPIQKNQFIGEYIGELLPTKYDRREILRKHLGLNYSFGLNEDYHIDSARVGNETRYINHGKGDKANATATSVLLWHKVYSLLSLIAYLEKLVLGDHRIGFYALRNIKANGEILFDYGDNYWKWNEEKEKEKEK